MTNFDLQMFNKPALNAVAGTYGLEPLNRTTDSNLSDEIKTFYDTALLENARANLVYNQFARKQALPARHGKSVEFRKFNSFGKATTPLTEGITPAGHTVTVTAKPVPIAQYGDYVAVSDVLEWAAVDPIIGEITQENGYQAGATLDTLTRNALVGDETVYAYANAKATESALQAADKINAVDVAKMATMLKKTNTPKIDGSYIAIIHPSVAYDLRQDNGWIEAHKYSATREIFNGEIGELHGVRFIETTEALITKETGSGALAHYHCFFFGKDAFGAIEPTGASLETIIKDKSEIGGPLNLHSTVGWKASHGAAILYPERMVDYVCTSTFSSTDTAN